MDIAKACVYCFMVHLEQVNICEVYTVINHSVGKTMTANAVANYLGKKLLLVTVSILTEAQLTKVKTMTELFDIFCSQRIYFVFCSVKPKFTTLSYFLMSVNHFLKHATIVRMLI